jgi:hypothetical protein
MAISMIIPIFAVVLVALIVFLITAGSKIKTQEGGEAMIKKVFIYLVLFATLMMTIGGSVGAFMAVADIVAPMPYHQSFEDFRQWGMEKSEIDKTEAGENAKLSDSELRARYEAAVEAEKNRQVERAKNSLVKSLGWIIIPLPVFIIFQRRLSTKELN